MKTRAYTILCFMCILVFLMGCKQDLIGTQVPENKRIPLVKDEPQKGSWEVFEFTLNYEYTFTQPKEGALGAIDFSGSFDKSPGELDSLSIWMYLLDESGRITEIKSIFDVPFREHRHMNRSFTVTVAAAPTTAGISFAHLAQASRGRR